MRALPIHRDHGIFLSRNHQLAGALRQRPLERKRYPWFTKLRCLQTSSRRRRDPVSTTDRFSVLDLSMSQ
ncbi:hypothetical protein AAFF_G00217270 [Aldrovandia affinis]|uniref:Uncharacterized protein n=1 Tax=Aldrovandia affinis TaxID=143900 RepID=A0AAD7SWN3_9TELE|nr:hypothetical protein AAFF_G00217270 [Aldrovandia affinis]